MAPLLPENAESVRIMNLSLKKQAKLVPHAGAKNRST
jgi:hypothetical protein